MNFAEVIYALAAASVALVGLFGWNYSTLSKRIDRLAVEVTARKTDADLRVLISDKLEPYSVRLDAMSKEILNISHQYSELDRKIDSIISMVRHNVAS